MTSAMSARLEEASSRQKHFTSSFNYTLEEFGLSEQWVAGTLGEVLDAYGLER